MRAVRVIKRILRQASAVSPECPESWRDKLSAEMGAGPCCDMSTRVYRSALKLEQ